VLDTTVLNTTVLNMAVLNMTSEETSVTEAARPPLHLAVALDGAGWHPAAWREADARPAELLSARYWTDLVAEAEAGLLDFVTFEDSLSLQSADPRRAE
jgi:hypothetical protein